MLSWAHFSVLWLGYSNTISRTLLSQSLRIRIGIVLACRDFNARWSSFGNTLFSSTSAPTDGTIDSTYSWKQYLSAEENELSILCLS